MQTFRADDTKGQIAFDRFCKLLKSKGVNYRNASMEEQYNGIDLVTELRSYEVKHQSFKDKIVIEEDSMKGEGSGWIYTSLADMIVEVGDNSLLMIDRGQLKAFYIAVKDNYTLLYNDYTKGLRGDEWRSSYRIIPISHFMQYVTCKEIILVGESV